MFWLHQYMKFTSAFSINLFVWIPYCDIIWYNLRIKIILCAFSVKCTKAPNTGKLLYLTNLVFPLKHSRLHICTYATTIFTLILILSDRLSFLVNNYLRINPLSRINPFIILMEWMIHLMNQCFWFSIPSYLSINVWLFCWIFILIMFIIEICC